MNIAFRAACLWFFGIMLALTLGGAASTVSDVILQALDGVDRPSVNGLWQALQAEEAAILTTARFALLALLCIRFYIGSYVFFYADQPNCKPGIRDVLIGLGHYSFFLLAGESIGTQLGEDGQAPAFQLFEIFLLLILAYDFLWWAVRPKNALISGWVRLNFYTAVVYLAVGPIFTAVTGYQSSRRELVALAVVAIASIIDLSKTGRLATDSGSQDQSRNS